jgi:hypothetical protein
LAESRKLSLQRQCDDDHRLKKSLRCRDSESEREREREIERERRSKFDRQNGNPSVAWLQIDRRICLNFIPNLPLVYFIDVISASFGIMLPDFFDMEIIQIDTFLLILVNVSFMSELKSWIT